MGFKFNIFWAFLLRSRRATGYAIASETPHAAFLLRTLRVPNAKEVFFVGFSGLPTHPPTGENEVKNTSFYLYHTYFCEGGGEAPALVESCFLHKKAFAIHEYG